MSLFGISNPLNFCVLILLKNLMKILNRVDNSELFCVSEHHSLTFLLIMEILTRHSFL